MKNKFLLLSLISSSFLGACKNQNNDQPNLDPNNIIRTNKIVTFDENCKHEFRGGFNLASDSTILQIARVELCNDNKVNQKEEVYRAELPMVYLDLEESIARYAKKNGKINLPTDKINTNVKRIEFLKNEAISQLKKYCDKENIETKDCEVTEWRAVANPVFKNIKNWDAVKKAISNIKLDNSKDLTIKRLSEKDEALFGYYPITQLPEFDPENSIVWDLGEDSSQFTFFDDSYNINLAQTDYTNMLLFPIGTSTFKSMGKKIMRLNDNFSEFNPISPYNSKDDKHNPYVIDNLQKKLKKYYYRTLNNNKNPYFKNINNSNIFAGKRIYVIGKTLTNFYPSILNNPEQIKHLTLEDKIDVKTISEIDDINHIVGYGNFTRHQINYICNFNNEGLKEKFGQAIKYERDLFNMPISVLLAYQYIEALNINNGLFPIISDETDTIIIHPEFTNDTFWN